MLCLLICLILRFSIFIIIEVQTCKVNCYNPMYLAVTAAQSPSYHFGNGTLQSSGEQWYEKHVIIVDFPFVVNFTVNQFSSSQLDRMQVRSSSSGKLPFDCQKIDKNLAFFQKNCQKLSFFSKKLPMAIFLKKIKIFGNFLKKCQVFGNFLTVKWQFSGGSACNK